MIDVKHLRELNSLEHIVITAHAYQRLTERKRSIADIMKVIAEGEIIKQYEDDKPLPSCLILGLNLNQQYLHVVVSVDEEYIYLITAYYPTLEQWESDYKTRRR